MIEDAFNGRMPLLVWKYLAVNFFLYAVSSPRRQQSCVFRVCGLVWPLLPFLCKVSLNLLLNRLTCFTQQEIPIHADFSSVSNIS